MKTTIHIPDMECESCERVIGKALRIPGITEVSYTETGIVVEHDPKRASAESILDIVQKKGYAASLKALKRISWHSHVGDVERLLLRHVAASLVVLFALQSALVLMLRDIAWLKKYLVFLLLLDAAIVSVIAMHNHLRSYRATVTTMTGMMLAMILGMQSGMMIGFILGATNGFFIGALASSVIGMVFGALCGRCCGSVGIVQGMMSGFMGGLMGPMTSVMLAASGFEVFLPWFYVANLGMLWAFSILLIENVVVGRPGVVKTPVGVFPFIAGVLALGTIVTLIIIFGPIGPVVVV